MLANEAAYYLLDELADMCRAPLEYKVVNDRPFCTGQDYHLLNSKVTGELEAGWRPVGGITLGKCVAAQTMMR